MIGLSAGSLAWISLFCRKILAARSDRAATSHPEWVSLRDWGEAKPKASNASATGRAENRSVEIMINQVSAATDDSTEVREMNLSR